MEQSEPWEPEPVKPARAAVILAAGEGVRFEGKTHKLLTPFGGKPLALWSVEAALEAEILDKPEVSFYESEEEPFREPEKGELKKLFTDIYVVMGSVDLVPLFADKKFDNITLIQNDSWESGQGCSLNIGITCARKDGHKSVVVGLADAPLVASSDWEKVATTSGVIVTTTYENFRSPPVKLEDRIWDALPFSGDEGAKALMRKRPELVVEVKCKGNPTDIDTMADLQTLEKRQGS